MSCSWDKSLKIWDLETGRLVHSLQGHKNWIHCVSFSPNGDQIASGSEDKIIKIWNMDITWK